MKRQLLHIDICEPKENEFALEMEITNNQKDIEILKHTLYSILEQGEKDNKEFVKAFMYGVLHFALQRYSMEELISILQNENTGQSNVLSFTFNQSKLKS